ncbi:ceramide-1-phosphate transfer protein-like [Hydra vulgaris]|uniref:Ceramide-1-phosphate transfer protein-like n=1 Tax=Hydra vulgaris TaxID=6087 RepID=A0ABM4C130_HYDVU
MSFDFDIVIASFKTCAEDKFNLEAYNRGYNELCSFIFLLGTVFKFIANDIREKTDLLEEYRKGEKKEHYSHVQKMLQYEVQIYKQDPSFLLKGSGTLIKLHRALKFTQLFLKGLTAINDTDSLPSMVISLYNSNLANFHPWLIRNAPKLAMYTLPSKNNLFKKIFKEEFDSTLKLIECAKALEEVFVGIEDLYTQYDLHSLN